ncbi:TPA: secretin and TonB N-terminal domain-containing protein, partial [Candidatus Galligastranaerophilus faecipullorum]|nr:secretin and TonB N-terminal domain-containing protein [Candidatus Galligastranaerophilus faecipullorum]
MFTQKTKSIVQKFTVLLMLFSLVQSSWAGLNIKNTEHKVNGEKIAFTNFDMPANYYQDSSSDSGIMNINNYVEEYHGPVNLNQGVKITNSDAKISLSLRDSDVKQVLRMFAQKAGINVIFHSSVSGKVTLDLVNVTLNDAFLMVLRSAELTYVMDGKNLIVASNAQGTKLSFTKQSLTIIPVKYERAQNIANFLNNNVFGANITGLSNDKIVTSNPATNEIMLFGSQNDVEIARQIVEKLDRKPMINTFKVNHTTPKEMAMLLCSTFVEVNKEV